MISQSTLFEAKAFLCWDKFADLSIQLIPVQKSVAYFYPPSKSISSIILFYHNSDADCSEALFLLFHEAGHFVQWNKMRNEIDEEQFLKLLSLDKGSRKMEFENQAWQLGKELLIEFFEKMNADINFTVIEYNKFSNDCLSTYRE